jgi:hypothetical protein
MQPVLGAFAPISQHACQRTTQDPDFTVSQSCHATFMSTRHSISLEPSFQDIAKTADPAKIKEQLRHANEQLELMRQRYPGRERAQPLGKGH